MIPTFSVNTDTYNIKVCKLITDLISGKLYSNESVSDIYIKIVQGEDIRDISAYSRQIEKNSMLKRFKSNNIPIISEEERELGYYGVSDTGLITYDIIDDELSKEYLIEEFLEARENLYYSTGSDIYRLIELISQGDYRAKLKLDELTNEFPKLKLLLYDLFTTPNILEDLRLILS